jgi:hypothetical protein
MTEVLASEISVELRRTIWHYNPEETLQDFTNGDNGATFHMVILPNNGLNNTTRLIIAFSDVVLFLVGF